MIGTFIPHCPHKNKRFIELYESFGAGWFKAKFECVDCKKILYSADMFER